MPAPATVDEFLDLIQKSGVQEPAKLAAYADNLKATKSLPAEPSKLAGLMVRDALLTYFQAEQILQGKWKRFFIGKYKVLERLGTGGMGQVFLCEHKLMRRRVAVKVLPTAKAADPSSLGRFYREARAVAALDHPNIVRAYDIDQDENLHFLVMEFVDGTNLQDLVKKFGKLDILRACHYMYGSAVGLQYAFEMGILHRDIKPGNILIDRTGVIKILDMGLARFFNNTDEDDNLTKKYDENVLGTADYLAPEQAVDSHTVDIRADIYSLGGTFYFLLAGQPPFPEGSVAQKLLWHQTREPKTVQSVRPDVPAEIAAIVARMMAKEADDRYTTPAELITALAPFVQTPIPPPPEREMPQFSPAAVGATGSTRPMTSGIIIAGNGPGGIGGSSALDRSAPTAVARGDAPPSTIPTGSSLPPLDAPAGVWEALAAETQANARSDTGPTFPPNRPTRRLPTTTPPSVKRRSMILIAAAALVVIIGGCYALYKVLRPATRATPTPKAAAAEVRTWNVSRAAAATDPARTLPNLLAAIAKAGPGDTIVLADDTLDDPPLKLDGSRMKLKDVTIEAGNPAKSVRWTPASTGRAAAALEINGIEGLRLRGLIIDAPGQFDYGITITGHVPGLIVEDVAILGPRLAGMRLANVSGSLDKPVLLSRVRVTADGPYDAGVVFAGDARLTTQHAQLAESRIDGPAKTGVRIEGPAVALDIRHTRVFNVEAGVTIIGLASPRVPFTMRIAGNSFHSIRDTGIKVEMVMPANLPNEVIVTQNYFARTSALARGPGKAPGGPIHGLQADTNARDNQSKEGPANLKAIELAPQGLPVDPNKDDFLIPTPTSPLTKVGPKQLPVGIPPR